MIIATSPEQAHAILRAMHQVGTLHGRESLTAADRVTLEAAAQHVFHMKGKLEVDRLAPILPPTLATILPDPQLTQYAVRFLTIMALVDGVIDENKIAPVLAYARALDVHEDYLQDLTETAQHHIQWVAMDMMRHNVQSIAGLRWNPDKVMAEFLPYSGSGADQALARRYGALESLPQGTLGRLFWEHYRQHGYPFPGEKGALNAQFATPHDSTHILSGYSTSPQGELLVSTFTAAMHKKEAMAGHILPVIFSWHLGIELNPVAGSTTGALDPEKFWVAWDRGAQVKTDIFGPGWDFWALIGEGVDDLREWYQIPPLVPAYAASGDILIQGK
jgi:hypothetical protein